MLSGKLTRLSKRWLLASILGLIVAVSVSMVSMEDAEAAPLSATERFLANKHLWFEHDWDRDWVCYMYDIQRGTTPSSGPYLRVVRNAYPVNLVTGECRLSTPLSPAFGGVGQVSATNVLRIQWPSGYVERIKLVRYFSADDALSIRRSSTGDSWWVGCNSPYHPYC
jgi:hypothetical protein